MLSLSKCIENLVILVIMSIEEKLDIVLERIKSTWQSPGTFEHLFQNDPFEPKETRMLPDKIIKDGYAQEANNTIEITAEGAAFSGYVAASASSEAYRIKAERLERALHRLTLLAAVAAFSLLILELVKYLNAVFEWWQVRQ
jgi:hypothetical protein